MEFEELQSHVTRQSDSPLFARLAAAYLEQGDSAYARELCLTGIEHYPAYTTGFLILAKCYAVDSRYEEAIETIKRARKLFPDAVHLVSLQREWERQQQGAPSEEVATNEPVIEQPAGDGEIVSQTLAEIYVQQGLLEQAIESYLKLIERKPAQRAEFEKRIGELQTKMSGK